MALTEFQINALQEVENLFKSIPNLDHNPFQEVVGKKETYLMSTVKAPQHILEIYIYEDETGYFLDGGEWRIFEKPDYPSSSDLVSAFLADLRNNFVGSPIKNGTGLQDCKMNDS